MKPLQVGIGVKPTKKNKTCFTGGRTDLPSICGAKITLKQGIFEKNQIFCAKIS